MALGKRGLGVLSALIVALAAGCGGRATGSAGDEDAQEGLAGSRPMVGGSGSSNLGAGSTRSVDSGGGGSSGSTGSVGGLTATAGVGTGSSSAGGSASTSVGSGGSATMCVTPEACGGPVEGRWQVRSSCLRVSGEADISLLGLGCGWMPLEGSLTVSGALSVTSDGAVDDRTMTVGAIEMTPPPECLEVAGALAECSRLAPIFALLGYQGPTCQTVEGACRCRATVSQLGSMGVISVFPATQGQAELTKGGFSVSSADGETAQYSSCTRASSLLVTPRGGGLNGDLTGAITLERL
jgi:hypothetical protein